MELRPEHDFLENEEYLKDLVKRVGSSDELDTKTIDEIVHADYYINKLIRQGSSEDFKSELEQISSVLQGVLDTYDSKKVLISEQEESDDYYSYSLFNDDYYTRFLFRVIKIVIAIVLYVLAMRFLLPDFIIPALTKFLGE